MTLRVLFFASVADLVRARSLSVASAGPVTVGELRKRLEAEHPALAGRLGKCAAAVNSTVAGPERKLADGDEVAFLPPVSGG